MRRAELVTYPVLRGRNKRYKLSASDNGVVEGSHPPAVRKGLIRDPVPWARPAAPGIVRADRKRDDEVSVHRRPGLFLALF